MRKTLLLGDEAIALGALHAGIKGVYAYPGTPSTEITEYIQKSPLSAERKIHCTWCTNEKTAMEAALGMSYAGMRSIVCMKHVGLNVAADAFVNSAITAFFPERARLTFLWKICLNSYTRTFFATRSLRNDTKGF